MTDRQKVAALLELLYSACEALAEHGDESTLPYIEERMAEIK